MGGTMHREMTRTNPPTTVAAIEAFERDRGLTLPPSYKDFLLATNGGVPAAPAFPVDGMPDTRTWLIQVFSGIGVREPTSELSYGFDLYAGGIPEGIVPIAADGMGNYICLDLRKGRERVAFWDKRHFWGTGEWRESDLYHVANSFAEFLASLGPNPY
jgi:cell wall assembly regulator SMI1